MTTVINGSYPAVNSDSDATINGLTVGKGGGAVSSNTAVGGSALVTNSTGVYNSAFGYLSLSANSTGTRNTGFGSYTLNANTATGNNAFGHYTLAVNTSGGYNSAFGGSDTTSTLQANTTGSYNSGFGVGALANNTTASNNTAVGYQAGYSNTTGQYNTLVGYQTGYSQTSPTYGNTLIGYSAGFKLTTGTGNSFLGGSAYSACGYNVTTGNYNTIVGGFDGNQGGLDIRTSNNYIVLSDGNGNPLIITANSQTVALKGAAPNSGTGITFPATQSASTDANTLDDYEEGTFTPVLTDGTNTVNATGTYVKIGAFVWVNISSYNKNINGFNTSQLKFTGLPFATSAAYDTVLVGSLINNYPILAESTSTTLNLYAASQVGNGDMGNLAKTSFQVATAASIWGMFCYKTS
jgi:hypothetical protein